MASTALSLSILPHPPLVCHIPLTTWQISIESFPFLTTVRCLASVSTHMKVLDPGQEILALVPLLAFPSILVGLKMNLVHGFCNNSAIYRWKWPPNEIQRQDRDFQNQ
ncbi:hypothetical protein EUGRSUZ_J00469 [Eucalyptus grandis]|uniref:Uncharacterized protein n=2 Tax=Eucalyptus grandis TaxID=71139 RepID=A0A059ABQ7_EUCGR|nr:hypothetical protein EUGRSUZ_J00469 [Eucalyptus grandis]